MKRLLAWSIVAATGLLAACGVHRAATFGDGGPDVVVDAGSEGPPGDGNPYDTATESGCPIADAGSSCVDPIPDLCGSAEICDDGLDNDCNGAVDDGCSCTPGQVQPCFLGPPGRRNVGACTD